MCGPRVVIARAGLPWALAYAPLSIQSNALASQAGAAARARRVGAARPPSGQPEPWVPRLTCAFRSAPGPRPYPVPVEQARTRPRNRRGEGERLRAEIVAVAAELLDAGGEQAVTLRDIARRIGIASPSIYAHFSQREAIVAAVVLQTFAELRAELDAARTRAGDDPAARLQALCAAYLAFSQGRPRRYRILFGGLWSDATVQPQASSTDAASRVGQDVFELLVQELEACRHAGRSASTDAHGDAAGLWAALHGLAQLRLAAPLFPWPADLLPRMVSRLALLDG